MIRTTLKRILARKYRGFGAIWALHSVKPEEKCVEYPFNDEKLALTPEYFDYLIRYFKGRGFSFVTLDELLANSNKAKQISITFDDGYRDNLEYALPIAEKHEVPLTVYVATGLLDERSPVWWYLLEDIIMNSSQYSPEIVESLVVEGGAHRESFKLSRARFMQSFNDEYIAGLKTLFRNDGCDLFHFNKNLMLNTDSLRDLSRHPLVSIGAHTIHHCPLRNLGSENQVISEVNGSKLELETITGKTVQHFAYPFGGIAEAYHREYKLLGQCDFKSATTTRYGNLFQQQLTYSMSLPRIGFTRFTGKRKLGNIASGLQHFEQAGQNYTFN